MEGNNKIITIIGSMVIGATLTYAGVAFESGRVRSEVEINARDIKSVNIRVDKVEERQDKIIANQERILTKLDILMGSK